ncbi:hypothetical protein J4Q44_G00317520 [Coregonus suidteri]|uniref:Dicer dsRNA-binding fold domain-containing protein n=1 Tax=Coregonus suidteri TaxID=861788 RepID=A0AAN8QA25_9TELE
MSKMTVVHLGVIVFAICLSTQVVSQNTTESTGVNVTSTGSSVNSTTMATHVYSSSANSTPPTGAGVSLQSGPFSVLLPIVMATSLLHRYC